MEHSKKMSLMQRVMVQHANPSKLAVDIIAMAVAAYFFWEQNLAWGLIALFGISIIGTIPVWGKDEEQLAETRLGKWMLIQARPVNLIVRGIGTVVIIYGIWLHSLLVIVLGCALLVVARVLAKILP
jgi:hypothetical protein